MFDRQNGVDDIDDFEHKYRLSKKHIKQLCFATKYILGEFNCFVGWFMMTYGCISRFASWSYTNHSNWRMDMNGGMRIK